MFLNFCTRACACTPPTPCVTSLHNETFHIHISLVLAFTKNKTHE